MRRDLSAENRRSYLPWLLLVITVTLGATASFLFFLNRETAAPVSWAASGSARNGLVDWLNAIQLSLVTPIAGSIFGALIVTRRPGHRVGWLLIVIGLLSASGNLMQEWALYGYFTSATTVPGRALAAWVANWIWVILFSALLYMLAIFPDGRFLSRRWQRLISLLLLFFMLPLLLGTAVETPMSSAFQIPNPFIQNHPEALYNFVFR